MTEATKTEKTIAYNVNRDLNNWNTRDVTIKYYGLLDRDVDRIQLHGKEAEKRLAHLKSLKGYQKHMEQAYKRRIANIVNNGNDYVPKAVYRYELTPKGVARVINVVKTQRQQKRAKLAKDIKNYPSGLAHLYMDANNVLNSGLTSYQIEKGTGLNHSTILRLRHPQGAQGHRDLRYAPLKTVALLAGYPNKSLMSMYKFNQARGKLNLNAYLVTSLAKHHFSVTELEVDVANVLTFAKNISQLSRKTGINRSKLQRMAGKSGSQFYDPLYLKANDIANIMNVWETMKKAGRSPLYDATDIKNLRKKYEK